MLSNEVGASDSFLEPGGNGFLFQSNRYDKMIEAIEKIGQLSDAEYFEFSKRSQELASKVNLQHWTMQLLDWIKIGTSCAE